MSALVSVRRLRRQRLGYPRLNVLAVAVLVSLAAFWFGRAATEGGGFSFLEALPPILTRRKGPAGRARNWPSGASQLRHASHDSCGGARHTRLIGRAPSRSFRSFGHRAQACPGSDADFLRVRSSPPLPLRDSVETQKILCAGSDQRDSGAFSRHRGRRRPICGQAGSSSEHHRHRCLAERGSR
jgi:hypothetical protein